MSRVELPLPRKLMRAFGRSAEARFSPIAVSFGSRLERLSPSLYGFLAAHAVVTVGVYHGHFPGMCVKLRQRQPTDILAVDDHRDIGLANIVDFCDSTAPRHGYPDDYWTEASLDVEVCALADQLVRYGRPFMADPDADWKGLRSFLDERIKKTHEQAPWLRKYQKA